MTIAKKIFFFFLSLPRRILPSFVYLRTDAERFSIDRFIFGTVIPSLKPIDLVLDAGAGSGRYREVLSSHARYEATDFEQIFDQDAKGKMDFICSLDAIPKPDATYDVIVNAQVLEHVEYPQKVVSELYRILKPGGRLYLTTNQMFPIHAAPYNYFFYTRYGLESLFTHAGFTDITIHARGGVFYVLSKILSTLPSMLYYQGAYTGHKSGAGFTPKLKSPFVAIIFAPIFVLAELVIGRLLPFVLFYCDPWDRQQRFTLGYACICKKS